MKFSQFVQIRPILNEATAEELTKSIAQKQNQIAQLQKELSNNQDDPTEVTTINKQIEEIKNSITSDQQHLTALGDVAKSTQITAAPIQKTSNVSKPTSTDKQSSETPSSEKAPIDNTDQLAGMPDPKLNLPGSEEAASLSNTNIPLSGTASIASISKGIFGVLSTKAMLTTAAGTIGVGAILAWIFRRQIVNFIWVKKLTNNINKIGKTLDKIILENTKKILTKKDNITKKLAEVNNEITKLQNNPKADQTSKTRLVNMKKQLEKMLGDWDKEFMDVIDSSIDKIMNSKTVEMTQRINDIKTLKEGQKQSLKTLWDVMLLNYKLAGKQKLVDLKLVTNEEILNDIKNKANEEAKKVTEEFNKAKEALNKEYSVVPLKIENISVKPGSFYKIKTADKPLKNLKGNQYIQFDILPKMENPANVEKIAYIYDITRDEKTGALTKSLVSTVKGDDKLKELVTKYNNELTKPTIDDVNKVINSDKKNMKLAKDQLQKDIAANQEEAKNEISKLEQLYKKSKSEASKYLTTSKIFSGLKNYGLPVTSLLLIGKSLLK